MMRAWSNPRLSELGLEPIGDSTASADTFEISLDESGWNIEPYAVNLSVGSAQFCQMDLGLDTPFPIEGGQCYGHAVSGVTENLFAIVRPRLPGDLESPEGTWRSRDPLQALHLELLDRVRQLNMLSISMGINIRRRTLELLKMEPALAPPLIEIVQRIVPLLHRWDGRGSISIDSFSDPDTDLPETIRFVFHPSDDVEWAQVMAKWNEISHLVTGIVPLKGLRKRIIVSFEPEF